MAAASPVAATFLWPVRRKQVTISQPAVTQRSRAAKRALLGPVAPLAKRWALSGEPSRAKAKVLRRVVVPAVAAAGKEYTRDVPAGFRFGGNARDLIEMFVYLFGVWEPNLTAFIERRLGAGDTFVDVGANSGWFTLLAASRVGRDGHVVSVEASPLIAKRLQENVRRNGFDNVRVVVSAAGREPGEVEVVLGPAEQTSITKVRRPAGSASGNARVPCDTLPSLLTDEEVLGARIVKIDVEGAEFDVVAGLGPALDRFAPTCEFVVEVGPGRGGGSPADVATLMRTFTDRGFVPYALPNVYNVAGYLMDQVPETLARIEGPLTEQTDVVFSRQDTARLVL